jgi:hypothetical protein
LTVLAAFTLATALAGGSTMVGCGGGNSGSGSSGQDSGTDSSPLDAGKDTNVADSNVADTFVVDSNVADTNVPDNFVAPAQVGSPTFTPPDGTSFTGSGTVTINPPSGAPAGTLMFYSTNGTVPSCPGTGTTGCTGSGYAGPIDISTLGATTVWAIAAAPGNFVYSTPVKAVYTVVAGEAGPVADPVPNPTSTVENNDFLVSLTSSAGATICYTLDGNAPTCTNGACSGGAATYNGATEVSINGSVTDPATGKVTLNAIACDAAGAVSNVVPQQYQLVVADPTMINPAPGTNIPWVTGGLKPTISTATVSSNNPVTIRYNTGGTGPTCITGTALVNPTTFDGVGTDPVALVKNTTVQAVACKQGYAQSNGASFGTFAYTIQLNSPTLLASGTYNFEPSIWNPAAGGTVPTTGVNDQPNTGAGDWLCASLTGDPVCGATAGTCTAPSTAVPATRGGSLVIGNTASATTTVKVTACAPAGLNSSEEASSTVTLQYAPSYVYTQCDTPSAEHLPGWAWGSTGQPIAAMQIPSTATTPGYPYAGGGATCGAPNNQFFADITEPLTCTGTAGDGIQGGVLPFGTCTVAEPKNSANGGNQAPDYFCFDATGTATCGATAGACGTGSTAATFATPATALGSGAGVSAASGKNVLSIIPCANPSASTNAPNKFVFSAPTATNVTFSAAGQAVAPGVSGQKTSPSSVQDTATITNNDPTPGGSQLCVAFGAGGGTAPATPTCTAGACATTAGIWCWSKTAGQGWIAASTGNCATAGIPGSGTETQTISPGPQGGAVGSPTGPGLLQTDGEVVVAVACNATETTSPASSPVTYAFKLAKPDFTSNAGIQTPQNIGDLDGVATIAAGATVNLSSTSNFDLPAPATAMGIYWAVGNSVTCGSPNVVAVNSVTQAAGKPVVSNWFPPASGSEPVAPTTGSTWTISAVACGQNDGVLQQLSDVRTQTFNLAAAVPLITTNQFTGTSVTGCTSGASTTCTPVTTWENGFNAYVSSVTPGASICYSTNGNAPSCSNGTCGNGSTQTAGGAANPIPVTLSGTNLQVLGCAPGLQESAPANITFTLNATKALAGQNAACGTTTTVALSTSTTDTAAGGPTPNACVCYSTDGNTPLCQAATGGGCVSTAPDSHTTCFSSGGAGTTTSGTITVNGTTTINTLVCNQGFNATSGTQLYSIAPYTHTITVDGNLSDWTTANEQVPAFNQTAACNAAWGTATETPPVDTLFTYDATNAYIGVNPSGAIEKAYAAPNTWSSITSNDIVFYLGSGSAAGATSDLPQLDPSDWTCSGNRLIPSAAGVQFAILWNGTGTVTPGTFAWSNSTLTWSASPFTVNVGYDPGTDELELGIPLAGIGTPSILTMTGLALGQVGITNTRFCGGFGAATGEFFRWPSQGGCAGGTNGANEIADWFVDTRSSCQSPNSMLH